MKACITGATSGIGKALAHLLAAEGYSLLLSGRDGEELSHLQRTLQTPVTTVACDLALPNERESLLRAIHDEVPDLSIHSAGFGLYGEMSSLPLEAQLAMIEVNCSALMACTHVAAKALIGAKKRGAIVNISSVAAFHPAPLMSLYAATKAFVTTLSEGLDMELRDKGIRVLTFAPGQVETPFARRAAGKEVESRGLTLPLETTAKALLRQVERQKRTLVFDWRYRLSSFFAGHFLPKSWVGSLIRNNLTHRL